jgi:hypothetical protein
LARNNPTASPITAYFLLACAVLLGGCVSEQDRAGERQARLELLAAKASCARTQDDLRRNISRAERNAQSLRDTIAAITDPVDQKQLEQNIPYWEEDAAVDRAKLRIACSDVDRWERAFRVACERCASPERCETELRRIREKGGTTAQETACP